MDEKKEILKVFYNDQTIIDDEDGIEKELYGLVEFKTPYKGLAALLKNVYIQCLNPVHIGKDGKLHRLNVSIGGNIYSIDVERYNDSMVQDGGKITKIYFKEETKCYE